MRRMGFLSSGRTGGGLLVFVAYLVAALVGLQFAPDGGSATAVWAASGIAVAGVLLVGWRAVPAVWLAAFVANLLHSHTALLAAAGIATGNTLEPVAGTLILLALGFNFFEQPARDYMFVITAAVIAAPVSATFGYLSLDIVAGVQPALGTWLLGDVLGILVVTPAILLSSLGGRH